MSKSATPINSESINSVYKFENTITNFQGKVTLYYEDLELNGVNENNLIIQFEDETNTWNPFSSVLDATENSLAYTFSSPSSFLSVTASDNTTLSYSSFSNSTVSLFPNPTINSIHIKTDVDIEVTILNVNGQKILTTREKSIDLSKLSSGIYLFKIKNISNNRSKTYKVLKQ